MASLLVAAAAAAGEPASSFGLAGNLKCVYGEYEIVAALVDEDFIQMVRVPKGARILDVRLATDDLETTGTDTVIDVGDGDDTGRYINGSVVAQAGGVTAASAVLIGGIGYLYTAEDTIDIRIEVPPATGAVTGTLKLWVTYLYEN